MTLYHFDYIISGAGAAGLSLLMRMMQEKFFDHKTILVLDKVPKEQNDHTWCFWENKPGLFEPVVHHKWQQVHFFSNHFSGQLDLAPYSYKMIRALDFYNHVRQEALRHSTVTFIYGEVEAVGNEGERGLVIVDGTRYTADYVFNSILFHKPVIPPGKHYLLQHFKGVLIETTSPVFNPEIATLMDFRVSQKWGTTFMYVLPVAANQALIEYTLFTKEILQEDEYTNAIQHYIKDTLSIENYTILEEEFGIIPMTNIKFIKRVDRVINLGTAGGQTKGSSGYTFQFIQKHSEKLVSSLIEVGYPKDDESIAGKRFQMYDSIFLNVLQNNRLPGDLIFSELFKKNPTERVLRFLDNESTLEEEINLVATLPTKEFMKAGWQEIFR
ncbi:MAG TPA: lycopene cyclase family protein [Segetibacter sp.]